MLWQTVARGRGEVCLKASRRRLAGVPLRRSPVSSILLCISPCPAPRTGWQIAVDAQVVLLMASRRAALRVAIRMMQRYREQARTVALQVAAPVPLA